MARTELEAELAYYNKRLDEAEETLRAAEEDRHDWWVLREYKYREIVDLDDN